MSPRQPGRQPPWPSPHRWQELAGNVAASWSPLGFSSQLLVFQNSASARTRPWTGPRTGLGAIPRTAPVEASPDLRIDVHVHVGRRRGVRRQRIGAGVPFAGIALGRLGLVPRLLGLEVAIAVTASITRIVGTRVAVD